MATVTASVSSSNDGTDFTKLWGKVQRTTNRCSIRVKGSFVGTVQLQAKRQDEDDSDAIAIESYTQPVVKTVDISGSWLVRLYCTSHITGTIDLAIYDDD